MKTTHIIYLPSPMSELGPVQLPRSCGFQRRPGMRTWELYPASGPA